MLPNGNIWYVLLLVYHITSRFPQFFCDSPGHSIPKIVPVEMAQVCRSTHYDPSNIWSIPTIYIMYISCIMHQSDIYFRQKIWATQICPKHGDHSNLPRFYEGLMKLTLSPWDSWVAYFQTNPMRICIHVISTIRHFPEVFLSYDKLLGFVWSIHIYFHLWI